MPPQTTVYDPRELVAMGEQAYADLASRFPASDLTRVRGFLDNACGRTTPSYHPHQSSQVPPLHIPGLPPGPFLDKAMFEETAALEQAYPEIRQECASFLDGRQHAVQYERTDTPEWPRWKKLVFYDGGPHARIEENCRAFPFTSGVVDRIVAGWEDFLSAGFLVHDGQVAIKPHVDWFNLYVSIFLPIYVPPDCGLEVGNERRLLVEGECIGFDNSYRHASWNHSDKPRIVLAIYRFTPHLTGNELAAFIILKKQYGQLLVQAMRSRDARVG